MSQEELEKLQDLIKRAAEIDHQLTKYKKMVAVMFVDIVGSTRYFERHGDVAGLVWVHECMDMLSPIAQKHGGTICKTIGDALMTYFEDAGNSVKAAIEMQRMLGSYNSNRIEDEQLRVRVGVNFGPGVIKEKDVFGDVVNTAARIESMAKADQIFISADLEEAVRAVGMPMRKISDVTVRGKSKTLDVYEVLWRDLKADGSVVTPARLPSPTVAARVPVNRAPEKGEARGTVVMSVSPMAMVGMMAGFYSLSIVRPDGSVGMEYKLEKPVTVLGRVDGDIVFPDDALVSRRHARFTVTDKGVVVEDLNSANGIFWRLKETHELRDGDTVLMGRQMFRFAVPQPPAAGGKDIKGAAKPAEKSAPGKEKPPPAELVRVMAGGVEENHYPLMEGENILGRTRGNVTFPDDAYLSSQHARISVRDGKGVIEDLRAANGTFIGVRDRVTIGDGDIVLVGHQLLRVTKLQN